MSLRLPVEFVAEYRGQRPAGSFVDRGTGEHVSYGPALKFEYETADGDIEIVPVRATELDKCEPPFDHAQLKKGDQLSLSGFVVLQDRGSERDSYFSLVSVRYRADDGKALKTVA